MSAYTLQIQKCIAKADEMSWPADKIKFIKEAISIADLHNDIEWGFDLRLELIREEKCTSGCHDSFAALAWIIQAYEQDSDLFSEDEFLWEYKWMIGAAYTHPTISKEKIEEISLDYKRRLENNGYSIRPYLNSILNDALRLNDKETAIKYLALRNDLQRDDQCDCEACELDDEVDVILLTEGFDKALAKAQPLISKTYTCAHVPFLTLCKLAAHTIENGNKEAGEMLYAKIEEELKPNSFDTSQVVPLSNIIKYLSYSNRDKALEFYEKYSSWNIDSEPFLDFKFCSNILHLFSALKNKETITLNLDPRFELYNSSNSYNTKELYNYYLQKAQKIAGEFDARNGNKKASELLKKEVALSDKLNAG